MLSIAEQIADLSPRQREHILEGIPAKPLLYDWSLFGRPEQQEPPGDWKIWLILTGRGWGKSRTGAEWIRKKARLYPGCHIALIAPTAADVRDVMVEGSSGVLSVHPPDERPQYEPSKRRITWANGTTATTFSADEPDRLRGPQHEFAWMDELASWRYPETYDMAMFGLRLGSHPQVIATTTPRPTKLIQELASMKDGSVFVTRGSTYENRRNLAGSFLSHIEQRFGSTRMGRQEIAGEILDDVVGALWTRAMLDEARVAKAPDMRRVVVAVDPSGTSGSGDESANSVGIVVAGLGIDARGYILADFTCDLSPAGWGRRAVDAYHRFHADRIIAERNFGGAMVESVIRTADRTVPYKDVVASRGKVQRAEPVAALFEQGRVKLVGAFPELEDQLCAMTTDGYVGEGSPDRADACAWALTELMVEKPAPTAASGIARFG